VNRTLLRFVLWQHRFAFVASWIVPVLVAIAVGFIYPTYAKEREALTRITKIFDRLLGDELVEFMSPIGFLLLPFQHPLTLLMLSISAAVVPLAFPAGERGRGALDMLLSTPLTRRSLARTVGVVILLAAATFGWAPYLGVWLAANISGYAAEIPFQTCAIIALNAGALVLALGSAAFFCSVTADDARAATARFVGFVVFTLAIDVIARVWKDGRWLRWGSLLGYYHPYDIVVHRVSLWLTFGVLIGFSVVVYLVYEQVLEARRRA
jgi:hypothetical protein